MPAAPILEGRDLSRVFVSRRGLLRKPVTLHAVDSVSFSINKGESLGLVGESGCGKSTLGRMACGLLPPSSGQVFLHSRRLPLAGAGSWAAGKAQMIFQDPASSLNPRMKAGAAVAEPLAVQGMPKKEALATAAELLAAVGLPDMAGRYPHQFSGGQRQRIAIARALASRPDVIVCDEPVSALDASVQAQVLNLLKDMEARFQPSYLFISHSLAVVGFMCSRILVMYLGQIVEEGSREDLFEHAAHPYTRALLASMPQGEDGWKRQTGDLPPPLSGELPSPVNRPQGCFFHPRCPICKPVCECEAPPWMRMGAAWRARCHFAGS